MKLTKLAILGTAMLSAASANATSILYRVDNAIGTDYLGAAISATGYSVTQTSGDLSGFNLADYDAVVYANQDSAIPTSDVADLNSFVASGGKLIFNDWTQSASISTGAAYTGNTNLSSITLGGTFGSGISGPLTVTNSGWGTYSTGLSGGISAATFENGDSAIVIGNGGRTITNGFLSDTVASQQLYTNEIGSLFSAAAVPEPATWAMMIGGIGMAGGIMRRQRRVTAKVAFA